jgi:hypothetical protein
LSPEVHLIVSFPQNTVQHKHSRIASRIAASTKISVFRIFDYCIFLVFISTVLRHLVLVERNDFVSYILFE